MQAIMTLRPNHLNNRRARIHTLIVVRIRVPVYLPLSLSGHNPPSRRIKSSPIAKAGPQWRCTIPRRNRDARRWWPYKSDEISPSREQERANIIVAGARQRIDSGPANRQGSASIIDSAPCVRSPVHWRRQHTGSLGLEDVLRRQRHSLLMAMGAGVRWHCFEI